MSNELSIVEEKGVSLAELMGVSMSQSSAGPAVARISVLQNDVEKIVEMNGKKLKDVVLPAGSISVRLDEDTTVYGTTASIRIFAIRQQFQRWNSTTEKMEKTVMAVNLNKDLQDNLGGFNLGRPSGYVEDFSKLPEATQTLMRSVKRVKIFMGLVTIENPLDGEGQPSAAQVVDVPFIMDVKNRDTIKSLDESVKAIGRKNLLPILHTITLSGEVGSIPTGATYAKIVSKLGTKTELQDGDNDTIKNFLSLIEYMNGKIIDEYHQNSKSGGVSSADAELIGKIINVKDEE